MMLIRPMENYFLIGRSIRRFEITAEGMSKEAGASNMSKTS